MPRSMTAFARTTADFSWGSVSCELRSVNHRFLEIGFRMPETIRELEMQLREMARKKLKRGKVDCALQLTFNSGKALGAVDAALAQQYIDAAEKIAAQIRNPAPISPLDIMKWPGVLKDQDLDTELLHQSVLDIFDQALNQMLEGRQREGKKLGDGIKYITPTFKRKSSEISNAHQRQLSSYFSLLRPKQA